MSDRAVKVLATLNVVIFCALFVSWRVLLPPRGGIGDIGEIMLETLREDLAEMEGDPDADLFGIGRGKEGFNFSMAMLRHDAERRRAQRAYYLLCAALGLLFVNTTATFWSLLAVYARKPVAAAPEDSPFGADGESEGQPLGV
ncbi:MAG: hypothetical protein QGH74_08010 [Candidatus Brocadiia bacterium]|jgi:hypothetical protein|nr:hypothetical protein [Candidatus Brocadiia bacterium]